MNETLQLIQQLVGMAGAGVTTTTAAVDLAQRVQGAFKAAKPGSDPEVRALLADLSSQVVDAKLANVELKSKLFELLTAMERADETKAKLARYSLYPTMGHNYVYALRESERGTEPPHFICPRCYEDGQCSILQGVGAYFARVECKRCGSEFAMNPPPAPSMKGGSSWSR